uniref:Protein FAM136A n=1 Tax=Capra hircus TaxID=9925 RepID=A0A8C2R337_CAPHI
MWLQQLRVQEAVDSPGEESGEGKYRKMQGLMFRCSTGCCADSQAPMQQVHQCIKHCHASLAQGQALVTSELEKFQDRPSKVPDPVIAQIPRGWQVHVTSLWSSGV